MLALTQESDEVQTLSTSSVRLLLSCWLTHRPVPTCFPESQSRRGKTLLLSVAIQSILLHPLVFHLQQCCERKASLWCQSFEGGEKASLRSAAWLLFHPKLPARFLCPPAELNCCGMVPGMLLSPTDGLECRAGRTHLAQRSPLFTAWKMNGNQLWKGDYFIIIVIGAYN